MPEQLQKLMKELDRLLEIQSQALDRMIQIPSEKTLSQVKHYEGRIDILLAEICAIRRRTRPPN
jgi:hypothetical protein